MAEESELTEIIKAEAALPKKSESDGQMAEGRSLTELIAADKHVSANRCASPKSGIRLVRGIPPGAMS